MGVVKIVITLYHFQWLFCSLLHKWREGYLLPTCVRKITLPVFQLNAPVVIRSKVWTNTAIYSHALLTIHVIDVYPQSYFPNSRWYEIAFFIYMYIPLATVPCRKWRLLALLRFSGGTNIRKFEGLFIHQSFDCAHAHFEYGRDQIALPVGGHVANFSQGCFSSCKVACASDGRQQLCYYFSLWCVEVHFKGQQFS